MHILLIVLANPKEPEKFQLFPNKLDENQSITILCSANVGNPLGNIKIWKISQYNDAPVLIQESKATTNKAENCTEFINVNFTYTVTRDDNEALFRCSSQNNFTQGPGPSMDSLKISVICLFIFHYFELYLITLLSSVSCIIQTQIVSSYLETCFESQLIYASISLCINLTTKAKKC